MATDHFERPVHDRTNVRIGLDRPGFEQLDRKVVIPHRAVSGTVDGLVLRPEEVFDLVVGRVDRTRPSCLFLTLATQTQRRFGKGRVAFLFRR